ncbi:hypothetical protein D8M05_15925 [Oceanobacillus bengalensis]|uniref:DUF3955 domain-containing protein n=1 Tax=Oceanobacillus bengalensis TaxID=1435466 RepID=A0A494YTM3_9BACI|nr:hypothetical protein [Oceanobacillus bengalensis]RKQ13462.1 hypothetical protein D8M05_15925 [Oceanobacillus bengalensis]
MKKHNRTGKLLYFIGILLFAIGFTLNQTIGIIEAPEPYTSFSIPLIVIGIILLVASNFFKSSK